MSDPHPFLPPGSATIEDFARLDLRVGRVVEARAFPEARRPAYQLLHRLRAGRSAAIVGPAAGHVPGSGRPGRPAGDRRRRTSRPGGWPSFASEVLVLGALPADGSIPLLSVDEGASRRGTASADRRCRAWP